MNARAKGSGVFFVGWLGFSLTFSIRISRCATVAGNRPDRCLESVAIAVGVLSSDQRAVCAMLFAHYREHDEWLDAFR